MNLSTKYPPANRGKIVFWGQLASHPFGGMTWQVLHHLVAFRRLGFDVWYVEDSDRMLFDPKTYSRTFEFDANVNYLSQILSNIGLGDRWVFRPPGTEDSCLGSLDLAGLKKLYAEADAVFNLSGYQELLPYHSGIRTLVYLQTDPVAEQVEVANGNREKIRMFDTYNFLFTYGENLGANDCLVPMDRYCWHPTRPPVYLDWWTSNGSPTDVPALTTVANLKHTGHDVAWCGEVWRWSKHVEFIRFAGLAQRSALPLEMAVGSADTEDERVLRANGWRLRASVSVSEPEAYRNYICSSLGEFTVAKEQYVLPRSGWFSDRSVCYLAAGRPVITQDTGFGKFIPTGEGLFSFQTEAEALAAIEAIAHDYLKHSTAARDIAREFFDAERVLSKVLQKIGLL